MLLHDETLVCLECLEGYAGPRCDLCSDGFFGDPTGKFGPVNQCKSCECNQNVDRNAVGNCNRTSGECLKCIHNTGGDLCDQCLPGRVTHLLHIIFSLQLAILSVIILRSKF